MKEAHIVALWPSKIPYPDWIDLLSSQENTSSAELAKLSAKWARIQDSPQRHDHCPAIKAIARTKYFDSSIYEKQFPRPKEKQLFSVDKQVVHISNQQCSLLYTNDRQFLLTFSFILESENDDTDWSRVLEFVNRKRRLFTNLDQDHWVSECLKVATSAANEVVHFLTDKQNDGEHVTFPLGSAYPLSFAPTRLKECALSSFLGAETSAQVAETPSLTEDHEGSFFHAGWDYCIAGGIPLDSAERSIAIVARAQVTYHSIKYFRAYLIEAMQTVQGPDSTNKTHQELKLFNRLVLNHRRFALEYERFLSGLAPKWHEIAIRLEECWNLKAGFHEVEQGFATEREFFQRRYDRQLRESTSRQGLYLFVIAQLQVAGIFGLILNAQSLKESSQTSFWIGCAFVFACCLVALHVLTKNSLLKRVVADLKDQLD